MSSSESPGYARKAVSFFKGACPVHAVLTEVLLFLPQVLRAKLQMRTLSCKWEQERWSVEQQAFSSELWPASLGLVLIHRFKVCTMTPMNFLERTKALALFVLLTRAAENATRGISTSSVQVNFFQCVLPGVTYPEWQVEICHLNEVVCRFYDAVKVQGVEKEERDHNDCLGAARQCKYWSAKLAEIAPGTNPWIRLHCDV